MSELIQRNEYYLPTTFEQAERFADRIAASSLCPEAFRGKPADVFIAMQMGAEVGLSPMQALQNIAVIKGRPSLWGDAALGVVRAHSHCQSVREWHEGKMSDESAIYYCSVTRRGQAEEIRSFSIAQAKVAGLWKKPGTWTQYPERMLQMRARGFAIRDTFPDALRGLQIAEEEMDIDPVVVEAPRNLAAQQETGTPLSLAHTVDETILKNHLEIIEQAPDLESLKTVYMVAMGFAKGDKAAVNKIAEGKNARKKLLDEAKRLLPKPVAEQTNEEWLTNMEKA